MNALNSVMQKLKKKLMRKSVKTTMILVDLKVFW